MSVAEQLEQLMREAYGRILATLIGRFGTLEVAEEALQEALVQAWQDWQTTGMPQNPAAWLTTVAANRAINMLRRESNRQRKYARLAQSMPAFVAPDTSVEDETLLTDDRLQLIFMCCHPALNPEAQLALTLQALCGLSTRAVAQACMLPEATMAQRLVRARRKIRAAGIPFRVPPAELLPERLEVVLAVLYAMFNEGYVVSTGAALIRHDLCAEAIRLAQMVAALLPTEPEAHGLLALMLFQHSRRAARVDAAGMPILLEQQDRALWDQQHIRRATVLLHQALRLGRPGSYQLQAAIAALHAEAASAAATDWPQIAALYRRLAALTPAPVIDLNLAVALAMAETPRRGLEFMADRNLAASLDRYRWFHVARADLLCRDGQLVQARAAYTAALALVANDVERMFIEQRLAELVDSP